MLPKRPVYVFAERPAAVTEERSLGEFSGDRGGFIAAGGRMISIIVSRRPTFFSSPRRTARNWKERREDKESDRKREGTNKHVYIYIYICPG